MAQADDFIRSFEKGYDTKIEQGGTNVSGGQKQRLCIARALLKKPKILILDDSTSAVDMKTDALIRKGFKEYIPDTTKIIIAQRVASVMDADMIVRSDFLLKTINFAIKSISSFICFICFKSCLVFGFLCFFTFFTGTPVYCKSIDCAGESITSSDNKSGNNER